MTEMVSEHLAHREMDAEMSNAARLWRLHGWYLGVPSWILRSELGLAGFELVA